MRFLSVCSGIEAASAAWQPLGWEAVAFSEIDYADESGADAADAVLVRLNVRP